LRSRRMRRTRRRMTIMRRRRRGRISIGENCVEN